MSVYIDRYNLRLLLYSSLRYNPLSQCVNGNGWHRFATKESVWAFNYWLTEWQWESGSLWYINYSVHTEMSEQCCQNSCNHIQFDDVTYHCETHWGNIIMASYEHSVSNHRQLDCSYNNENIKAHHHHLWRESACGGSPSQRTSDRGIKKAFPCRNYKTKELHGVRIKGIY